MVYLSKKIRFHFHLWDEIYPEDNENMIKEGYDIILRRTPKLRKNQNAVSGIDAKSVEILKKRPELKTIINDLLSPADKP